MTPASADDLVGRLYGLLILVEDRLGPERTREAHHFIEVDEYAQALAEIAGVLGQVRAAITDQERDGMLALARQMTAHDFVSRALECCPRAGLTRHEPGHRYAPPPGRGASLGRRCTPSGPCVTHQGAPS